MVNKLYLIDTYIELKLSDRKRIFFYIFFFFEKCSKTDVKWKSKKTQLKPGCDCTANMYKINCICIR